MGYSVEPLDLTRRLGIEDKLAKDKPAAEPGGLFKAAANFTKSRMPEKAAAAAKHPAAKKGAHAELPSIISLNVELGGQIVSPEELHIYGTIEGDVRASSLVICTGGLVRGEVVADWVTVHGTVEGGIHGQSVQICAGGVVRGDIVHMELGIEKGGVFEGASRCVQDPMAGAPTIVVKKKGE